MLDRLALSSARMENSFYTTYRRDIAFSVAKLAEQHRRDGMVHRHEPMTTRVRNGAILVYMVGNALTFSKLLPVELAGLQETDGFGGAIVKALISSLVWPFYWISRVIFG